MKINNTKIAITLFVISTVFVLGSASDAFAVSVPIDLPGFESPTLRNGWYTPVFGTHPTEWTFSAGSNGIFNPSARSFPNQAPEGQNTAFVNSGSICQELSTQVQGDTKYTLSVWVGSRGEVFSWGSLPNLFVIKLMDDTNTLLASLDYTDASAVVPPRGQWAENTLEHTVLPGDLSIGKNLKICLSSFYAQSNFDDVRLDAITFDVPDATAGLSATPLSDTEIDLAWTAPSDNGSPIIGYQIERESPIGGGFSIIVDNTGTTATTYSDNEMISGTQYNYRVSVINGIGIGDASNESDAITFDVPDAPTDLTTTLISTQIDLSWSTPADNGSPIIGYQIERESPIGGGFSIIVNSTDSNATAYLDSGLRSGTEYNYRISAINGIGIGPASNNADLSIASTGGGNEWNTRPTFGLNHESLEDMIVDNGFTFNGNAFTLTDNHHTPFDQQTIEIGSVNSFTATVYADKDLKVQEFLFGVPTVGMGHLAETRVEVWFDQTGQIKNTVVVQDTEVIDRTSLIITHQKSKCQETDVEEKCDTTIMSAAFLEPLQNSVMAIKAIDFKLRDQTTYLNDGFDISGDSLNPMPTMMIPSPTKGEGLIKVTQNEKYSDYWTTQDGRLFEKNESDSFKQLNITFERFQDSGTAYTRQHSEFGKVIAYEQKKAVEIFDSTEFISELPETFAYNFPESDERITDEMIQEMIIQEHIAQKVLDEMNKQHRWN